jgi:hypothetical protein
LGANVEWNVQYFNKKGSFLSAIGAPDTSAYIYTDPSTGATFKVNPSSNSPFPASFTGTGAATGGGGGANQQGRYDPTELPTYAPLFGLQKQSLESQYQQAKKNIMGQVPRGGNLAGSLGNLEMNRAATMGALPAELSGGILGDMLNKAYGVAFQTPTTTLSGLGAAAGTYGNRQAAAMAQSAANQQSSYDLLGGIGQGIGKAVGSFK